MSSLSRLPPEIFQLISVALPLSLLSPTLFSLCLTSREIHEKTLSLLYFCIVLRHHDAATIAFDKIRGSPELGLTVKEIYILSEWSPAARRNGYLDYVSYLGGFKAIVDASLLPNLVTIAIFRSRWSRDPGRAAFTGHHNLDAEFWSGVSSMAPRIRSVLIRNLAHDFISPWVDEKVVDATALSKNLSSYNLNIGIPSLDVDFTATNAHVFKNVEMMQNHLHTLTLRPVQKERKTDNMILVDLVFPYLRCLELYAFHSPSIDKTSQFWQCHEKLERVVLWRCTGTWFEQQDTAGLLPSLTHLKAPFLIVRTLSPLLRQLRSLCIFETRNMQVPCLLRSIPWGHLSGLLSLEIEQTVSKSQPAAIANNAELFPSTDGPHEPIENDEKPAMDLSYIYWVAKTCPNLEELGFLGNPFLERELIQEIGGSLSHLQRLKHLYYPHGYFESSEERLQGVTRGLAEICPHLHSSGHLRLGKAPLIAWVVRDPSGAPTDVVIRDRWGMEISARPDDPFPDTLPWMQSF